MITEIENNNSGLNKRGVSVLIGYVLLVVFVIIIAAIVFTWLRTYVPAETLNCPDGSSVFIRESSFDVSSSQLRIILTNNGRFDLAGFFIHATNNSEQETATIDLSSYINSGGINISNSVVFSTDGNSMAPGDTESVIFTIPAGLGTIYSVTIIPVRYQVEDGKERFASCGNAKSESKIGLPGQENICIPDTCASLGYTQCNPLGWSQDNGCGTGTLDCGTCESGFSCDASGECYLNSCTPVSNPCGTQQCGTATNGTCGQVNCGSNDGLCTGNLLCETGQCVSSCNGIWAPPESSGVVCDGGAWCAAPGQLAECTCPVGYIPDNNGGCVEQGGEGGGGGGAPDCNTYCVVTLANTHDYTDSYCPANNGQCNSGNPPGDPYPGGDAECSADGAPGSRCCCLPDGA